MSTNPLLPYRSLLGRLRDASIASQAAVPVEHVRAYRQAEGIAPHADDVAPGGPEPMAVTPPGPAAGPVTIPGPAATPAHAPEPEPDERGGEALDTSDQEPGATPSTRRPRHSRIDPYAHLLGKVPDTEVARLAGVSSPAVTGYRLRRGIPASGRRSLAQPELATPTRSPSAGVVPAPEPTPAAPGVSQPVERRAFQVDLRGPDGTELTLLVVADDLVGAARLIADQFGQHTFLGLVPRGTAFVA